MKCGKPANVSLVLIGLHQVGVVGLREVIKDADESGLTELEEITDHILRTLTDENYVPDSQATAYRRAIQREFLRYRGRDIREYYSEVEVSVRGEAGPERERFVEMLASVFGDFELKPVTTYIAPLDEDPTPELLIGDEAVVRGRVARQEFKSAVRRRITEW